MNESAGAPTPPPAALEDAPDGSGKDRRPATFEDFPWWMVAVCNAVGLGIYGIGLYLMGRLGALWGWPYAGYCLWLEWRLLSGSCRHCYYYGKRCGFGKGRICSWFFTKQAGPARCAKPITWRDLAPDFLVSLVPLVVGIVTLVMGFSWVRLFLLLALVGLASAGTGYIRGQLACRYCKQRELGCPAQQFFRQTKPA